VTARAFTQAVGSGTAVSEGAERLAIWITHEVEKVQFGRRTSGGQASKLVSDVGELHRLPLLDERLVPWNRRDPH
jgi:hypothetical protein